MGIYTKFLNYACLHLKRFSLVQLNYVKLFPTESHYLEIILVCSELMESRIMSRHLFNSGKQGKEISTILKKGKYPIMAKGKM